jgi:hypothetical protein
MEASGEKGLVCLHNLYIFLRKVIQRAFHPNYLLFKGRNVRLWVCGFGGEDLSAKATAGC